MGRDAQGKVCKKYRKSRRFHLKYRETGSIDKETMSHRARLPKISPMTDLKMILFGLALLTL
jgi:hypothetical protein